MATTQVTIHYTGFAVGDVSVRFGILWPDGAVLMTDWARESRYVVLPGVGGLTETQMFGMGPRTITYRLYFDTAADYQALDALVQQSGSLTVYHGGHTVPTVAADQHTIHGKQYDAIACRLLALIPAGVAPDGTVEADAVFQATS